MVLSEVRCGDTDVCQVCQSKNKSRSHIFFGAQQPLLGPPVLLYPTVSISLHFPRLFRLSAVISIPQFLVFPTVLTPVMSGPLVFPHGKCWTVRSAMQLDTIIPEIEKETVF